MGVTHLRFRMGMGTWVFTHLPVPRFGFRVWVLGISQHSEFVQNTPNWPFFERYEVIFYVFYYGTYSDVATTTYVRLPMSDPSDSSQFRVSGGCHPSPSGEWVGILPTHPPDKTLHPPTIWVAGTRWVDNPASDLIARIAAAHALMDVLIIDRFNWTPRRSHTVHIAV